MPNAEVVTRDVMTIGDLPRRAQDLIERLGITLADPEEVQWRIAEQLAFATTPEELFGEGGPMGLKEHLGEKFYVRSVDYMPSTQKGSALYAVINAMSPDGEAVMYTTGATSVVVQLARGMQEGWFDKRAVMAKYSTDQPTPDGNRPYKLVQA